MAVTLVGTLYALYSLRSGSCSITIGRSTMYIYTYTAVLLY